MSLRVRGLSPFTGYYLPAGGKYAAGRCKVKPLHSRRRGLLISLYIVEEQRDFSRVMMSLREGLSPFAE